MEKVPGEYSAMYFCPLCRGIFKHGDSFTENADNMPFLLAFQLTESKSKQKSYHKMLPHNCGNGSFGVAYFVGFLKEE